MGHRYVKICLLQPSLNGRIRLRIGRNGGLKVIEVSIRMLLHLDGVSRHPLLTPCSPRGQLKAAAPARRPGEWGVHFYCLVVPRFEA
jgi:hypothetical protein